MIPRSAGFDELEDLVILGVAGNSFRTASSPCRVLYFER